jgi:hypothetical protein
MFFLSKHGVLKQFFPRLQCERKAGKNILKEGIKEA